MGWFIKHTLRALMYWFDSALVAAGAVLGDNAAPVRTVATIK
jgi:hypothetical protein